jgi:hypothetical protein
MKNLFLFVSLCFCFQVYPNIESDSGIFGQPYKEILNETQKWVDQNPGLVHLIDYGKSVEGRPLRMILVMKELNLPKRPAFLMSGSTHGNEFLAIETTLPVKLLEKQNSEGNVKNFLESGGVLVFVPILNPDGYDHRKRDNAHGVDLNRDWSIPEADFEGFSQPETKALAIQLEKLTQPPYNLNFQVTVDYHCCIGALLYPWAYTSQKLPEPDLSHHIQLAKEAKKLLSIDYGTTGDILGYYPMGTTKDYYYSKYHSLTYTYEGRFRAEDKYLESHVKWWETMIGDSLNRSELLTSLLEMSHPLIATGKNGFNRN